MYQLKIPSQLPTVMGLILALIGPPVIAWLFGRPTGAILPSLAGMACYALLVTAVLCLVRFWERRPLSELGLRRPSLGTLVSAAALAALYIFVVSPLMQWVLDQLGSPGFEPSLQSLATLPRWYRAIIVMVGVSFEELLYRGYAFDRLSGLIGSPFAAGASTSVVFGLAHAPLWGIDVGIVLILPAVVANAFYYWRRDLIANTLGHMATDLLGIALGR